MARAAQTDLAVLAVLSVAPMTGYAVREAIRDQLGHFWSESFGQIYPALSALVRDNLVEKTPADRAGSSTFSLTPTGRDRLLTLLSAPATSAPARNGLMLRIFFGRLLGPEACRALVQETKDQALGQLETFAMIRRIMEGEEQYAEHRPYWTLTVSAGEHSARAAIAWADETLAALETFPPLDHP
jgi:DNA-binding PadR family transcriptional regulator